MPKRTLPLIAGLAGATAVACGAFGAHGLRAYLAEQGTFETWKTAVLYHLVHALALLALSRQAQGTCTRCLAWAARAWMAGIGLFSGSLYWLALGGPRWLGPVTPLGGLAFLTGWLLIAFHGWLEAPGDKN